jgi:hypothetical protein
LLNDMPKEEFIMQARTDVSAVLNRLALPRPQGVAPGAQPQREERMPFRIRLVREAGELERAVGIRHAAYARHVPEFAASLTRPEPYDYDEDAVVLLAESKLDGSAIGTMRIKTNRVSPLGLEQSVKLPDWLDYTTIAEATRLGVAQGRMGTVVKTLLFKALFQYCQTTGVEWMVIAARSPMDRQYEDLLFEDVFPEAGFIPMRHAGGIPHRVLALDVVNAYAKWSEARHPLLGFMCDTVHPDIDLAGVTRTNPLLPAAPRIDAGEPAEAVRLSA